MNTAQQDALTLRRITVWSELFRIGYGKRRPELDSLSTDERSLLNDLTQTLHADLIYGKPERPAIITVNDAVAYAVDGILEGAIALKRIDHNGTSTKGDISLQRVENIIHVACTSVAEKCRR